MDSFDFEYGNEAEQEMPSAVIDVLETFIEEEERFEFAIGRDLDTQEALEDNWKSVEGRSLEKIFDNFITPWVSEKKNTFERDIRELNESLPWEDLDKGSSKIRESLETQITFDKEGNYLGGEYTVDQLFSLVNMYFPGLHREEEAMEELVEKSGEIQSLTRGKKQYEVVLEYMIKNKPDVIKYLLKRGLCSKSR